MNAENVGEMSRVGTGSRVHAQKRRKTPNNAFKTYEKKATGTMRTGLLEISIQATEQFRRSIQVKRYRRLTFNSLPCWDLIVSDRLEMPGEFVKSARRSNRGIELVGE